MRCELEVETSSWNPPAREEEARQLKQVIYSDEEGCSSWWIPLWRMKLARMDGKGGREGRGRSWPFASSSRAQPSSFSTSLRLLGPAQSSQQPLFYAQRSVISLQETLLLPPPPSHPPSRLPLAVRVPPRSLRPVPSPSSNPSTRRREKADLPESPAA